MRINRLFLVVMTLALAACGKKREPESAPPASAAPEEKRLEEEKSTDMTGSSGDETKEPEVPTPGTATGEKTEDSEPADTRDATPAEQPAPPEKNVKADHGLVAPMDAVKPTTLLKDVSSMGSTGLLGVGVDGKSGGGGTGGAVDADKALRQRPKRPPKTEAQATGYHDKEQDEPTQE